MTDKQSNHVDMILNVIRVYNDNQPIIDSKPDVGAQFMQLIAKRGFINLAIGGQSGSTATDKAFVRKALDEYSFGVMAPVKAWAVTQNDVTLKDDMDYSLTELSRVKDDTYADFLRYRRDKVNGVLGSLGGLGFTPITVSEWDLKISGYAAVVTDPRQAIINRALHTENLDKYIKEALVICNDVLDGMMVLYKGIAAYGDLYSKYVMAREIIDLTGPGDGGDTSTQAMIEVLIKNVMTGSPVAGVAVKLTPGDEELITGVDGVAKFAGVAPGVYNANTVAIGYAPGMFPVDAPTPGGYNFTFQIAPMP